MLLYLSNNTYLSNKICGIFFWPVIPLEKGRTKEAAAIILTFWSLHASRNYCKVWIWLLLWYLLLLWYPLPNRYGYDRYINIGRSLAGPYFIKYRGDTIHHREIGIWFIDTELSLYFFKPFDSIFCANVLQDASPTNIGSQNLGNGVRGTVIEDGTKQIINWFKSEAQKYFQVAYRSQSLITRVNNISIMQPNFTHLFTNNYKVKLLYEIGPSMAWCCHDIVDGVVMIHKMVVQKPSNIIHLILGLANILILYT